MFITHVEARLMVCLLEVTHFATLVYKSTKHFGLSFAFAFTFPTHSERSSKSISLQKNIHSNFCFSWLVALTPAMSLVIDNGFLLFLFGAP